MPESTQPLIFSSRSRTELTKFVVPGGMLLFSTILLFAAASKNTEFTWHFAVIWIAATFAIIAGARPIKLLTLEDGCFLISDFRKSISVPISHLCRVDPTRNNGVELHFSPTTAFGSPIRIFPPTKLFNADDYERVVACLFDTVVANGYHPTALPVQRLKRPLE